MPNFASSDIADRAESFLGPLVEEVGFCLLLCEWSGGAGRAELRVYIEGPEGAHVGIDDWAPLVQHDEALLRPAEVDQLVGDASKARRVLGWSPTIDFAALVSLMVDADLARERGQLAREVVIPRPHKDLVRHL